MYLKGFAFWVFLHVIIVLNFILITCRCAVMLFLYSSDLFVALQERIHRVLEALLQHFQ